MKQTPVENFVIFVILLLLYVQTSFRHYHAADRIGADRFKGESLYADVQQYVKFGLTMPVPGAITALPGGSRLFGTKTGAKPSM